VVDRRLLVLVSLVVFVETLFFTALVPLLPQLTRELDLSKTGAGVLSAAYPAGGTIGSFVGAWFATRLGVRQTVVVGLLLLAGCCAGFGVANDIVVLDALRFVQGAGAAIAWTGGLAWLAAEASPERRGELLGIAIGAAVAGGLIGPMVGGAARLAGRPPAFIGFSLLGFALVIWALRMPSPSLGRAQPLSLMVRSFRSSDVVVGFWLISLASILFAALSVLGPLDLDRLGVGALGLTMVWLVGGVLNALQSPALGRWSDRRGRIEPLRVGLIASIALSLAIPLAGTAGALAVLVLAASLAYNTFWVPGGALLTEAAEAHGLEHGLSYGLFSLAWAPSGAAGAFAAGALADRFGGGVTYISLAGLCAATFVLLASRSLGAGRMGAGGFEPPTKGL
jgi:predicted MFS family arabinose efflux permease